MMTEKSRLLLVVGCAVAALGARTASATTVQDLVRIKGHERNVLTGLGIVVGLDGTGDRSKDSFVAARPYAALLKNLGNPVESIEELAKADAYAIVKVTMEVPATGVREGDRLDVWVETLFNATSLEGGRLVVSPLRLPLPDSLNPEVLAIANGPVVLEGDNPRSGVVRSGGQMIADIRTNPVTLQGTMGLVLKVQYATYPVATTISSAINDEFALDGHADISVVEDVKNIKILLPAADRADPSHFIAALMTIPIDPSLIQTEARIVINEKEGIILVTGNVEIGPVGITHKGLTINSLTSDPVLSAGESFTRTRRWTGIDTTDRTSRSSTRLIDLLQAFEQLNVPVEDQIAIIYELRKTGALYAEIVNK